MGEGKVPATEAVMVTVGSGDERAASRQEGDGSASIRHQGRDRSRSDSVPNNPGCNAVTSHETATNAGRHFRSLTERIERQIVDWSGGADIHHSIWRIVLVFTIGSAFV